MQQSVLFKGPLREGFLWRVYLDVVYKGRERSAAVLFLHFHSARLRQGMSAGSRHDVHYWYGNQALNLPYCGLKTVHSVLRFPSSEHVRWWYVTSSKDDFVLYSVKLTLCWN